MTAPLTFAEVAREIGLSTNRFRHVWKSYVRDRAFPAPFSQPPGAHFKWDPDAVAAWKQRRASALRSDGRHEVANDVHPSDRLPFNPTIIIPAPAPALDRQRASLRALMARGA